MSYTKSPATVCLVEFQRNARAVETEAFATRLELVLKQLDSGALADGCHGSEAHRAALAEVIATAQRITDEMNAPKPRSCNRHDDCDAADSKARAAGHLAAEHCHDECCEDCFGN